MKGVLLEEQLQEAAWTALMTCEMTVIEDDGHKFPLGSAFFWPDESPGYMVRLEEDVDQFPTLVEMTHVASGRSIELPLSSALFDVLRQLITEGGGGGSGKHSALVVLMVGHTPLELGADVVEVPVPYDPADGTTARTWNVRRVDFRVSIAGGAPQLLVEKSTVAGAFSPSTVATVTMGNGNYEVANNPAAQTVASGDKLRVNIAVLGTAEKWTVTVLLEEV
jgi:hypothetical protein